MKSNAPSVARYLAEQPAEWSAALKRLRAACRHELPDYAEKMAYGMPSYLRDGTVEVAFAKQAHHLSLYLAKQGVLDGHRADLTGLSVGKGCIRYRRPDQIDWTVVTDLLAGTRASSEAPC